MQVPTAADVAIGAARRGLSVDHMTRNAMKTDVAGTVGANGYQTWRRQPATSAQKPRHLPELSKGTALERRTANRRAGLNAQAMAAPEDDRKAKRLAKRLCQSARNGDAKQMAVLLDDGAPMDLPGFGGNTALMVSAWNDRADCVALLLQRGADVDLGDPDYGYSPLILAAQYGGLSAARLLVQAGASLACKLSAGPDEGMTARALALGGSSRVYADPQPGRKVCASHSADASVGSGRIDSQHSAVALQLAKAERDLGGAQQRLAFASCFLDGHGSRGQHAFRCLPRNADGGCDLVWAGELTVDPAETSETHVTKQQRQEAPKHLVQLVEGEDADLAAAIVASLCDSGVPAEQTLGGSIDSAARCAWPHLHPPTCSCCCKKISHASSSDEMKLAERIASLDAAMQVRARTSVA